MTVRRAWIQIVKEYDKEKHYLGERTVYEEMRYTMNELKNGRPESEFIDQLRIIKLHLPDFFLSLFFLLLFLCCKLEYNHHSAK